MHSSDPGLLRFIAFFKFVKTATLIATGVGALKLVHADVGAVLEQWAVKFNLDPGADLVNHAIQKATELDPDTIRQLGIVSFIYAGLFLTEGTGLWLLKHWAEWFTIIITTSLIPFEVYEIFHRPNAIKVVVLIFNVAVVGYLVLRISRERRTRSTTAIEQPG